MILRCSKLNEAALRAACNVQSKLEIVPGATHLSEEPGTLEIVARLAGEWSFSDIPREENK